MSCRLLALLLLLLPGATHAERASYSLLDEGLRPPSSGSALGVQDALPLQGLASNAMTWRDEGSARELRGLVCVEHVFVDDPQTEWSLLRQRDIRVHVSKALVYLSARARDNGVSLSWRQTQSSYRAPNEIPTEARDHRWTEDAVRGATSGEGPFRPIDRCSLHQCEQRLAILHVMKPGRSYAMPSIVSRDSGLERAVMFLRPQPVPYAGDRIAVEAPENVVPELPASYVHELLHLFGAQDLYEPEARLRAAEKRYPNDIMLQSHRALESLSISDYTAYHVGWSEEEVPALPL